MYLKSIEMQGFKSFAHKIVFEFHNGITGIVGPNGSGKSNVADAVRWVLGEQSAKQLRGASMQDVIFAGTENRKPLSYAYVAITMDNADHTLPVDYEEVTIARRVYRSGESEYLLNGVACRLKDVTELFYDTGIGKEGYSIIGQGQIEKILSGKPEERRELFDEAVGIVKFKKRKTATLKKLESERENLVRINDILSELERRVEPLERQSEVAKQYLKKREELKSLDVNMYLLEMDRLKAQLEETEKNLGIAESEQQDNRRLEEKVKKEYARVEEQLREIDERIEKIHADQGDATVKKSQLENQIALLEEQIRSAESSAETVSARKAVLDHERAQKVSEKESLEKEKAELQKTLDEVVSRLKDAQKYYDDLEAEITACNEGIERDNKQIMDLLNERADIKSSEQHFQTMFEQTNIRKSQLTKRLLERKTAELSIENAYKDAKTKYDEANEKYGEARRRGEEIDEKIRGWQLKKNETQRELSEKQREHQRQESRLESLRAIAERYDGYGNAIRRVMENKDRESGLIGVVSDLISVPKKYEIAIETALGGNIQNIVVEDEDTAKKMISFLKENRAGRVTFLPLTSVKGNDRFKEPDALSEKGVLGRASELVSAESRFSDVLNYLLGRVLVVSHIDDATRIARKYHYSLHIVTLEGEYLSPGGSMTGGAFKNRGNLLARNREIEDIEKVLSSLSDEMKSLQNHLDEIETAAALLVDDKDENDKALQELLLARNTEKIHLERAEDEKNAADKAFSSLQEESDGIERELSEIVENRRLIAEKITDTETRETELKEEIERLQKTLDEKTYMETTATRNVSEIQIEEANASQKVEFVCENISRVQGEIDKNEADVKELLEKSTLTESEIEAKRHNIEEIKLTIEAAEKVTVSLAQELKDSQKMREDLNAQNREFFAKREEITERLSDLDKEIYRLNSQKEKAQSETEYQNNYMWENYELTLHAAIELRDDAVYGALEPAAIKKRIASVKDEIRRMGNVNVNAIEEYQEVAERYQTMKTQHDDIVESEEMLLKLIDELDESMRAQFEAGFKDIQVEFDKAFKELFGGGKGTLELVEGEDVLETGIKINAQPPGKKLQNMMQLSGGEKSLTAIALLFAIQNLKPSPFCLLDEIEAALDDANVGRFANYLHRLTENTQFIVITHRRGTMNAADRLYGITMQEKGVSALVSVNLIENDLDE